MVSVPPVGIASRAFTVRLRRTCSIWVGSALTAAASAAGRTCNSMCSPIRRWRMGSRLSTSSFRSRRRGCSTCLRLRARSCRVSADARSAVCVIKSTSRRFGSSAGSSMSRRAARPAMTVRRLLKSWATPPASRPDRLHLLRLPELGLGVLERSELLLQRLGGPMRLGVELGELAARPIEVVGQRAELVTVDDIIERREVGLSDPLERGVHLPDRVQDGAREDGSRASARAPPRRRRSPRWPRSSIAGRRSL